MLIEAVSTQKVTTLADFALCVPTKESVEHIAEKAKTYKVKGKDAGWNVVPWGLAAAVKDHRKLFKYFFSATLLGLDEYTTALLTRLKEVYTTRELELLRKYVLDNIKNDALQAAVDLSENFKKTGTTNLKEDIQKHDKLNPKLFDSDKKLKRKVRNKMLEIVEEFINYLKESDVKLDILDILFIGSNASYNYTDKSDIDLHIVADSKTLDCPEELSGALYGAYRSLFNKALEIEFYNIPVELYIEFENTARQSNGIYSVKEDLWVKEPVVEDIPEINEDSFNQLFIKWEKEYQDLAKAVKEDTLKDEKKICNFINKVYEKLRKAGIAEGEYAIKNLVFKELRNKGYLDKLKDFRDQLISKRLSLQERLDNRRFFELRQKLSRTAGTQVILQENGYFQIYNLKETEAHRITNALRQLPEVEFVNGARGSKYDFSRPGMPELLYNITGKIYTK